MFATVRAASVWNKRYAERPAFTYADPNGYLLGQIQARKFLSQRVIWKWMTGEEPTVVDHEDGQPGNNRWKNLKDGSKQKNHQNCKKYRSNSSGQMGVTQVPSGRWAAYIKVDKRKKHLGTFESYEEAARARKTAEQEHGFHLNHGRAA